MIESPDEIGESSGCRLHCLINLEEGTSALCNNTDADDVDEISVTEDNSDGSGIRLDAENTCVDTKEWCRFVNCALQEAAKLCPATCQKCSCKDKAVWCRFVDCNKPEAADLCPSTCNVCGRKEPEIKRVGIEGDIVGKIVKNDARHLLPNKVYY